ncbi:MAG TPA: LiaF domain-containing protein [Longimicrobiales bacterium]|nr:LiaF domain-containing protein [Longimicrobiales bacterium]
MFDRRAWLLAAAVLTLPASLAAQDWRTVTQTRQRSGESQLQVDVQYGAGKLSVEPARDNALYRASIEYDADMFNPVTRYHDGHLTVGVEGGAGVHLRLKDRQGGHMDLQLSRDVPLDLTLEFGAVEADMELGGLHIQNVSIHTGASETEVRFSQPNADQCDRAEFALGAAAFRVYGLGNLNCRDMKVDAGVGDVTLDFTGQWRNDLSARLNVALGSATLVLPRDIGVRVNKDTFLASFDSDRFTKRGGQFYSDNWDTAQRRLTLDLSGAFGSINVRWVDDSTTP